MNLIYNSVACIVMVVGLWLLLKLNRNAAGKPQAKGYCVAIFCVVVAAGGFFLYNTGTLAPLGIGKTTVEHVMDVESAIVASCGAKLGEHLVRTGQAQENILILAENGYAEDPGYLGFVRKLVAAGVPEANIVTDTVFEEAVSGRGATSTASRMSGADFDRAVKRHPESKYVVALVGLPISAPQSVSFIKNRYRESAPQLVGWASQADRSALLYGLTNGNVAAVIDKKEDAIYTVESLPSSDEAIFELRFQFLAKGNR